MLLQSHENNGLRLLPALPKAWKTGSVQGLTARGNITLDMEWSEGNLNNLTLYSKVDQSVQLLYKDHILVFDLKKGIPFVFRFP